MTLCRRLGAVEQEPHDNGLWTDLYHPDAAYITWLADYNPVVTFDVLIRETPFGGAYAVAAGIAAAVQFCADFRYGSASLTYLADLGYPAAFLDELARLRFTGSIAAVSEGDIIFPHEPILRVTAPFREALLMESGILHLVNTATLIATKAARIVRCARGKPVAEFGYRRAQAPLIATYAARIGGIASTSLLAAARAFEMPASGTIPHATIQLFNDEEEAFRTVARAHDRYRLLLDTYDTVAGARIAARVGQWSRATLGHELVAVRLDSGDLLALSRAVRTILDDAGLTGTQILASGDLDEWRIAALLEQNAPIDAFGVGTALVNGIGSLPHATVGGALGGVYKLAWVEAEADRPAHAAIKIAGVKSTWPGIKQVVRADDWHEDVVQLSDEPMPTGYHALLQPALQDGSLTPVFAMMTLEDARQRCARGIAALPEMVQALTAEQSYPVRFSPRLQSIRIAAGMHD